MYGSFTETGCKEKNLDTREDRMSERMKRSQKIRTCYQSMRPRRAIQAEGERNWIESVNLED